MANIRTKFAQAGFDAQQYQRYFSRHQLEYIRRKLRTICLYAQGHSVREVAQLLTISEASTRTYLNRYLNGGFAGLCERVKRPQKSLLTPEQQAAFKEVLLNRHPSEVGLEGNLWTGKLLRAYLKNTYQVEYNSGIYDLLERLNLSHQKAHADYGNARESDQIAFVNKLKDTLLQANEKRAVVKFDEFSICEKPSTYYAWAEKNTRPRVLTNEKKERAPTGS